MRADAALSLNHTSDSEVLFWAPRHHARLELRETRPLAHLQGTVELFPFMASPIALHHATATATSVIVDYCRVPIGPEA